MAISHKIFIDSTAFIAFTDRADINHHQVVKAFDTMARLNYQLFTSGQNITETYTALSREVGIFVASEFLQAILQSDIEVLFIQKSDLISASKIIRGSRERQISLREVLNAVLMEKKGISQILTFTYWHNLMGIQVSGLIT